MTLGSILHNEPDEIGRFIRLRVGVFEEEAGRDLEDN
jgi:hypothetical protein